MSAHRTPEEIRRNLKHPVVDGDGHWVEYTPVFAERMRKVVGNLGADGFLQAQRRIPDSLKLTPAQRAARHVGMEGFWGRQSTNTLDRATAMMPRLLYDRLDELGLDYAVIYPTAGLSIPRIADDATRRSVIRGFNTVTFDFFKGLEDRLTPVAVIPVHTPDEAIEELEFTVKQLGAKVCMFGSGVRRTHKQAKGADPDVVRLSQGFDQLGLDSEHDYDPLWQKCRELGIAPTFHTGGRSYGERNSPTNFTFNHIGHFAAAQHAVAKALFLGGVTRRFPDLRFAFLEGGVGWGCQLYCDLIEHWERRGAKGLANMDPAKLNRKLLRELVDKYGYADIGAELDRRDGWPMKEEDSLTGGVPLDDYHLCNITRKQDWIDLFATPYYFGCEADDRMNAVAFGKMMPLGARINALFSSDIGHFDVVDMRDPLPEAYELVEDGHITESDFCDFVFGNSVRLWGTQNPRFFEGTRVAREAAALLKDTTPARAAA